MESWIEFRDLSPFLDVVDPRTRVQAVPPEVPLELNQTQQPCNIVKAHGPKCGDLHQVFPAPDERVRHTLNRFDQEHGPGTVKRLLKAVFLLKSRAAFMVDIKEHGSTDNNFSRSHVSTSGRRPCPELTGLVFGHKDHDPTQLMENTLLELTKGNSALVFDWATNMWYVVVFCAVASIVSIATGLINGYYTHDANKGMLAGFGTWTVVSVIWTALNKTID